MDGEEWINPQWIKDRLEGSGRTQRELAKELGIEASQVSRLLAGQRKLKADEVPIIRRFFGGGGAAGTDSAVRHTERSSAPETTERALARGNRRRPQRLAEDIPVFLLEPGPRFAFREPEVAAEYRATIPQLAKVSGAFAMIIPDDRLEPRFAAGEVIYVNPNRPVIPGAYVVGRLKDRSGTVIIGKVLSIRGETIELRCANLCDMSSRHHDRFNRTEFGQLGIVVATEIN